MGIPTDEPFTFQTAGPSVYWVQVEGRDDKGRDRKKSIILFRHDWDALRVGDHWSKQKGFSPAGAEK